MTTAEVPTIAPEGDTDAPGDGGKSRADALKRDRRRRRRRRLLVALAVVLALLAVPGWSLGRTLMANSTDPLSVRTVEWARDHQLGGVVSFFERTWYSHHQPAVGGTPKGGIPVAPKLAVRAPVPAEKAAAPRAQFAPTNFVPFASTPLPGEGVWQPTGRAVGGAPALWVTYVRPDAVHTSLLAGVAYFDMSRLTATLHAGTEVPGGSGWLNPPKVALSAYPYVIAAFNSAFRLDNSRGGYYAEGRSVKPLVPGRASLVMYSNGKVDVGTWGVNDTMTAGVTSVRQNLGLIVDNGATVPGVDDAHNGLWGGTVGNRIYVWRSGVGVDARGNLIYVGGPGLNVGTLAELLRRAGSVRAMELDINTWWVSFTTFTSGPAGSVQPTNLLQSMVRPPGRYLSVGTRDFVEIDARH